VSPRPDFTAGGHRIAPGERATVNLPVSVMSDHTPVTMSVHVVHGRRPGPTMFVSAAIHGDEVVGVEIVRRLLRAAALNRLRGTLLAVPIVNSFGFTNHSRYMPDRRDLNRSFPGSAEGSLAARLARLFMQQIVERADVGIDIHSAAIHRSNLPQIRIGPKNPKLTELAGAFGAPVILTSNLRDGSLRQTAEELGVNVLLYEAGEGLRFDERAVRTGLLGILRVMRHLEMVSGKGIAMPKIAPIHSTSSVWLRAPAGGLLRMFKATGAIVDQGETLAIVADPFGENETEIAAPSPGLIVGRTSLPVVNEGDALFHLAEIRGRDDPRSAIAGLTAEVEAASLFDEDEII
jgi:predicted deacylase